MSIVRSACSISRNRAAKASLPSTSGAMITASSEAFPSSVSSPRDMRVSVTGSALDGARSVSNGTYVQANNAKFAIRKSKNLRGVIIIHPVFSKKKSHAGSFLSIAKTGEPGMMQYPSDCHCDLFTQCKTVQHRVGTFLPSTKVTLCPGRSNPPT